MDLSPIVIHVVETWKVLLQRFPQIQARYSQLPESEQKSIYNDFISFWFNEGKTNDLIRLTPEDFTQKAIEEIALCDRVVEATIEAYNSRDHKRYLALCKFMFESQVLVKLMGYNNLIQRKWHLPIDLGMLNSDGCTEHHKSSEMTGKVKEYDLTVNEVYDSIRQLVSVLKLTEV